ncbi:MAG: hypothetical protein IKP76_02275 [Bacilli bacterium]|nr:hypothetical protein [Bacilli bacterium]
MRNNKVVFICSVFLIITVITLVLYLFIMNKYNKHERTVIIESDFNLEVLKRTNEKNNDNYLVSPYSMEQAMAMLKDGASGNTKAQIEKLIGNNTKAINNNSVKDANGVFIKDQYKDVIENNYVKLLKDNHKAELLYDKFDTPEVINKWVNEKTDGMIPTLLNDISKDFVLGLANAIAIDVEWKQPFDGAATRNAEFTKKDGTKMNVNMMHNSYESDDGAYYIKSKKAQGIIIPYKDDTNLEFIAIMPDENIDEYIKKLDKKEFETLEESKRSSSRSLHINLGLPKFSYSYDYNKFMEMLKDMGMTDAFDEKNADFTNIIARNYMKKVGIENLYVSTAIHKTYIDLNEKGTKAAAVTYFGLDKATAIREEYDIINISFNKPFLYMIRDKKNNTLLFTGVVNTPSEYVKNTSR